MIDKTFHYSDPERVVCNACKFARIDIERGLICIKRNEEIKAYWTCEYANT